MVGADVLGCHHTTPARTNNESKKKMKKLLIAIAIVCATAFANAASMNWELYAGEPDVGLKVYLCSAVAAFENEAQISDNLIGTIGNTAITEEGRDGGEASGTVRGLSDDDSGKMQSFYYVIVNKDGSGYWTQAASGEIYTTSSGPESASVDVTELLASTPATLWSTGPTPVPEPTSGLMLILGMAGLALKRKRA